MYQGRNPIRRTQLIFFGLTFGLLIFIQTPAIIWPDERNCNPGAKPGVGKSIKVKYPGIVIALFVGLYIDLTQSRISRIEQEILTENLRAQFNEFGRLVSREPFSRLPRNELLAVSLQRFLGASPPRLDPLIENILGAGRPPVFDCNIDFAIYDSDDPDHFLVDARLTMKWSISKLTVALVADVDYIMDWVARSGGVDDVIGFDEYEGDIKEEFARFKAAYKITYVPTTGTKRRVGLEVRELDDKQKRQLLGVDFPGDASRITIFSVDLPKTNEPIVITYAVRCSMKVPMVYWTAEQPIYINSITYDFHGLSPERALARVQVSTFVPGSADVQGSADGRTHRIDVDGWLLTGHGAQILWPHQGNQSGVAAD